MRYRDAQNANIRLDLVRNEVLFPQVLEGILPKGHLCFLSPEERAGLRVLLGLSFRFFSNQLKICLESS